jgi:hypothetical protein
LINYKKKKTILKARDQLRLELVTGKMQNTRRHGIMHLAASILLLAGLAHSIPMGDMPCFAPAAPSSPTPRKNVCRKPVADHENPGHQGLPSVVPIARRLFEDDSDRRQQRHTLPAEEHHAKLDFSNVLEDSMQESSPLEDVPTQHKVPRRWRQDLPSSLKNFATNGLQIVLAVRAWLELRLQQSLESRVGLLLTVALPKMIASVLPSVSTRHSMQELAYLSASVWADALYRIIKYQFSVVLHALWRQGLIIAHSFR